MSNTIKEQLLEKLITQMIQTGYFTLDDLAEAYLVKLNQITDGTGGVQISLWDTPAVTRDNRKVAKGDEVSLMDSDGKLYQFISKVQASRFLNRSDGYVKQCVANNTPIYAKTKDGRRGEEYVVWTKNDQEKKDA